MKIKLDDVLATLVRLTAPPPRRYPFVDPAVLAKGRRTRRRLARARSREASTKRGEEMKSERATSLRARQVQSWQKLPRCRQVRGRMLMAMEPTRWYGAPDLVALVGAPRGTRTLPIALTRAGWLTRAENPAWAGQLSPQAFMAGAEPEPRWLYTLTEEGEKERGRLIADPRCASEEGVQISD